MRDLLRTPHPQPFSPSCLRGEGSSNVHICPRDIGFAIEIQSDWPIALALVIEKATYGINRKWLVVEAGGIEPPSRDISMKASTCVVEGLFLASDNAYRQGFVRNQRGALFNSRRALRGQERSGIATGIRTSPADILSQGSLFRLPLLDLHLQLSF